MRYVCMEPCLKVHSLTSVRHKSIKLSQMISLNVIFHVVVSIYRLVEIWHSPQFLAQTGNGLYYFYNFTYVKLQYCHGNFSYSAKMASHERNLLSMITLVANQMVDS